MKNSSSLTNITRESITVATLILMDKNNYHTITITDICKKAGVSRNAFYRNYQAKDEIIRLYLFDISEQFRIKIRKIPNLTNKIFYTSLFTFLYENKDLAIKVLNAGIDYLLVDVFFRSFRDFSVSKEYPVYFNCHLVGAIYSIFLHWVSNSGVETPEEIANLIISFNHINPDEAVRLAPMSPKNTLMFESKYGDLIYKE